MSLAPTKIEDQETKEIEDLEQFLLKATLKELTIEIRNHYYLVGLQVRRTAFDIWKAGKLFLAIKKQLPYGQFEKYCKKHFPEIKERTRRRYMEIGELEERTILTVLDQLPSEAYRLFGIVKTPQLEAKIEPLPAGTYTIIYADPPWQFDNSGFNQSAAQQYPTLSTEQICNIPVKERVKDPSVLFLWSTNAMLEDALKVMEEWNFEYKSNIVWCKPSGPGIGWFVDSRHELLLIGVKGKGIHPEFKPISWFEAERIKHSKKPDEIYEIIEKMYPNQSYIELFARQKRTNWEVWGNEV